MAVRMQSFLVELSRSAGIPALDREGSLVRDELAQNFLVRVVGRGDRPMGLPSTVMVDAGLVPP